MIMAATQTKTLNGILEIVGGTPLHGTVRVRGAKNAISKEMVAALLTKETSVLHNVPNVEDVAVVAAMIEIMGGRIDGLGTGTLRIDASELHHVDYRELKSIARRSRIPILFAGPLLARFGEAMLPELGGCGIGKRPIDYHIDALEHMGVKVESIYRGVHLTAKKLVGAKIHLEFPSVGTTEQVILSAVLADGITTLSNAAIEPEILDLIAVLQKMGALISVGTDRVIEIQGVKKLSGFEHTVITDRMEVASWACAAAVTNGEIFVENARQGDMMTFLNAFRRAGGEFEVRDDGISFSRSKEGLKPLTLETGVHPGFMTDWQQPFVVMLTQAKGTSLIHETVYEERFGYVAALNKMGAKIELHTECLGGEVCRFAQKGFAHSAIIEGPTALRGAEIEVPDLRAGFSYVVAALAAEGTSVVRGIGTISRGYENFVEKLQGLNANIQYRN